MNNNPIVKIDFKIVDSLRGLAALYVCIAHCRGALWIGGNEFIKLHPFVSWSVKDWLIMFTMSLTKLSGEAVIFFFVLSGFSIAHSLTYQPKATTFFYKRVIRLYPPYILGLVVAIIVVYVLKTSPDVFFSGKYNTLLFQKITASLVLITPIGIIKTLLYSPDITTIIGPYWSLVYEVIFYIGAIIFLRNLKFYYILSCIFFVAGFFIENKIPNNITSLSVFQFVFEYNFFFMAGVYVYHNIDKIITWKFIVNKYWSIICIVLYIVMILLESKIEFEEYNICFLLSTVTCIIMITNMLSKKIYIRPFIEIGKFSYTLYVTHFPIVVLIAYTLFIYFHVTPPYFYSFCFWIPAVFICLILARLFYFLIEERTKKYLDHIRIKRD